MLRPQAPSWKASAWEHKPSSSISYAVPMRLSKIGQHIKDEPFAKQRALLDVLSSRYSSVSRGIRSIGPIFLPLVHLYSCVTCVIKVEIKKVGPIDRTPRKMLE